jgi:predicted O-methyltransferase YrrM
MTLARGIAARLYHVYANRGRRRRAALQFFPKLHTPAHPRSWTFPQYLDNPACPWLGVLKDLYSRPFAFPASLSPEAGLLVHALVRNIRPTRVIETGSFVGISTIWIAAALLENGDGGELHYFDRFEPMETGPWRPEVLDGDRRAFVQDQLRRAGLDEFVHLHAGDSPDQIRKAAERIGRTEFVFLDADHSVEGVARDLRAAEPLIPTGGHILLHDVYPEHCNNHGPRFAADHANRIGAGRYQHCDLYLAPVNYGLALLRRVR